MSRAKVVLVGTGRMGAIRAKILYSNPRVNFCGVVDVNEEAATKLATAFNVSFFKSEFILDYIIIIIRDLTLYPFVFLLD